VIGSELAIELVRAFVNAKFDGIERHQRRVDKILMMERNGLKL
jgi:ribose 5-phosphate isomerase RpiB